MKKVLFLFLLMLPMLAFSQENPEAALEEGSVVDENATVPGEENATSSIDANSTIIVEDTETAESGGSANTANLKEENGTNVIKIKPEFPNDDPDLIFVEGEDAVSTNFNWTPTFYYSCSNNRTLQLNSALPLKNDEKYYADYVFFAESDGEWEFWYGGTPPGPKDENMPSYTSPFSYVLDDSNESVPVFREDVAVVENYTPSYYWNYVGDMNVTKGLHKIRFQVDKKRGFDSKYYFYLDSFFLVKKDDNNERVVLTKTPKVFPIDMEDRSIDHPFQEIEDYQIYIQDNPQDIRAFEVIANTYSLLGNYLYAIKYLNRAALLEPDNLDILLLIAKNRIWKGDIEEGLDTYRELLEKDPKNKSVWVEAGKVAGWTGRNEEAVQFFRDGLAIFPNDLTLLVNLGITYLWDSKSSSAKEVLQDAKDLAAEEQDSLKELGGIFIVNGYPGEATPVYQQAIKNKPEDLEAYLLLKDVLVSIGKDDEADTVDQQIRNTFETSERLDGYLETYEEKQSIKSQVLGDYEIQLEAEPNNLALRQLLAQAYFWRGYRDKAIQEYINIIINNAYNFFVEMDEDNKDLLEIYDANSLYFAHFNDISQRIERQKTKIAAANRAHITAKEKYRSYLNKVDQAKKNGTRYSPPTGEDPVGDYETAVEQLKIALAGGDHLYDLWVMRKDEFQKQQVDLRPIEKEYAKNLEAYEKIWESINWRWDRKVFETELKGSEGNIRRLALHVLGRIYHIDGNARASAEAFTELQEFSSLQPAMQYNLVHNQLWQEDIDGAKVRVAFHAGGLGDFMPFTVDLDKDISRIQNEDPLILKDLPDDSRGQVNEMNQLLDSVVREIREVNREIDNERDTMNGMLEKELWKTMYTFMERTYLLRNELGNYYLADENLDRAIDQFHQVIAVDPTNLEALYRIGSVYHWNNEWKLAMDTYKKVYDIDPTYENSVSLYNDIARAHTPTMEVKTSNVLDSGSSKTEVVATYATDFFDLLGLKVKYGNEGNRLVYSYKGDDGSYSSRKDYYLMHDINIGFKITIPVINWQLTPNGGGYLVTNRLYSSGTDKVDGINQYSLEPYGGVDFQFPFGQYIYLSGGYLYGRYKETFATRRLPVYTHNGRLTFGVTLGELENPILSTIAFTTAVTVDVLDDTNIKFLVSQDIASDIVKLDRQSKVAFGLGASYEDTLGSGDRRNYFAPDNQLTVGGGPSIKLINIGQDKTGVNFDGSLKVKYQQSLSSEDFFGVLADSAKTLSQNLGFEGMFGAQFVFNNISFKVDATYTQNLNLADMSFGYWNFALNLGGNIQVPIVIVP